jgi:tocopherol O-methyltransferase
MITENAVASHYDELDYYYRTIWGEHVHHGFWKTGKENLETAVCQLIDLLAARSKLRKGAEVFDVGSGYGGTARYLAEKYGARVSAITLSRVQFEFAKGKISERAREKPKYFLGNWLKKKFPSDAWDAVISIESTEHMNKEAFLKKAFQVLRPGGRLVVCAWLTCEEPAGWEKIFLLEPICREGRLDGMGSSSEYLQWIEEAGFLDVSFEDLSRNVRKTWALCAAGVIRQLATNSEATRFLLNHAAENRVFAKTVFRIWLAYQTGSMQFGIFTGVKPLA